MIVPGADVDVDDRIGRGEWAGQSSRGKKDQEAEGTHDGAEGYPWHGS